LGVIGAAICGLKVKGVAKRLGLAAWARTVSLLISAFFWFALLAVSGIALTATGVAVQFGLGYGLITAGVLVLVGAEVVRSGMIRA
jgi:hypothetical protein